MKDLSKYLMEASISEFSLNKHQVEYLENHFKYVKFICTLDRGYMLDITPISNDKASVKLTYDGKTTTKTDIVIVFSKKISLPLGIDIAFAGRYANSKVTRIVYHKTSNTTSIIFTCDDVKADRGFASLYGTIEMIVPGDFIRNTNDSGKAFDGKAYCDFMMKTYLKKNEQYLRVIDTDEIISHSARKEGDTINIDIRLETGKGYSSHFREKTYIFDWRDGYYECKNAQLYDNDFEAQVVRKYISGLVKFLGVKDCPQSVWVNVSQELD